MKLTILKEVLKEGVEIAEKISTKSFSLPILQTILLKSEKNFLNILSTNLETGVCWWGLSKVEKEGEICLPTKLFSQLVNFLPQKSISLYQKDLTLFLEGENFKTQILGSNPEEFPIFPTIQSEISFSVEAPSFCQALFQLAKIPSPSSTKPEIAGIFLNIQGNLIKIVATDGFRLAEKRIWLSKPLSNNYTLIIPQSSAREIFSIFGENSGELAIYISPHQIWFQTLMNEIPHPKICYTSRLIEGEYPNYEEIIPNKFNTTLIISKEEFLHQIKTASLFSGKGNEIKLTIDPKKETIIISSQSPHLGSYESSLRGKVKGEGLKVTFNYRFLTEGILEIKTPEMIFEFTDEEGPAILKPIDLGDYFYILMPIKTS